MLQPLDHVIKAEPSGRRSQARCRVARWVWHTVSGPVSRVHERVSAAGFKVAYPPGWSRLILFGYGEYYSLLHLH